MTRQQSRAKCFADSWASFKVRPPARSRKSNPIMSRKDRRKLARAYAIGNFRKQRGIATK